MTMTGNYRTGTERFVPSPGEIVLLIAMFLFCWKLYGGSSPAIGGLSSMAIIVIAWVAGVGLRIATNELRWWLLVGFVIAVLAPFLAGNSYQVGVMAQVCVFAMMIFGLNLVTGYAGQISIGHGALVGLSAYTIAILVGYFGWQLWPAIFVAVAVTTVFGCLLGIPALRLAGPYLAIATLAVALIFPLVVKLDQLEKYDGGNQGTREARITPPDSVNTFLSDSAPSELYKSDFQVKQFSQQAYIYYILLAVAVVGFYTAWNLGRGRFGRAFIAVRDGEVAATSMGVNLALYKVMAFGISAFYAGIAGALFWVQVSFVSTESFDLFNLSIYPLAYMVIGGLASVGGSIVGAFAYLWVPQSILKIATINKDFGNLQGAITGLLLVVFMTRLPRGAWGWATDVNKQSWSSLATLSRDWAARRPNSFWLSAGVGLVIVVLTGVFIGAVWSVFAAGILIVAPTDAWGIIIQPFRRSAAALQRRNNRDDGPPPAESAPADAA